MNRGLYPAQSYGFGRVYLEFTFTLNNTSSPLLSTIVGVGGDVVSSLTRTGAGVIVVQLSNRDKFKKVVYASADLDDTADDGAFATIGNVTNEGSASTGIAFTVRTRAVAGAKTDFTARLCHITLAFRNSNANSSGAG